METRKDRKSAMGMSGSPKKGGHNYKQVEMEHSVMKAKDLNLEDLL